MQWRWVLTLFHTTGNVSLHFPWLSCRHCPIYFEVWRPHLPWQGTLCCFLLNLLLFYWSIDLYKSKRSRCNISVHGWLSLIVFFCCVSSSALVCQLPFWLPRVDLRVKGSLSVLRQHHIFRHMYICRSTSTFTSCAISRLQGADNNEEMLNET